MSEFIDHKSLAIIFKLNYNALLIDNVCNILYDIIDTDDDNDARYYYIACQAVNIEGHID
jgi:hypothetical protein